MQVRQVHAITTHAQIFGKPAICMSNTFAATNYNLTVIRCFFQCLHFPQSASWCCYKIRIQLQCPCLSGVLCTLWSVHEPMLAAWQDCFDGEDRMDAFFSSNSPVRLGNDQQFNIRCTGDTTDTRKSFPSGHSSVSSAIMTYKCGLCLGTSVHITKHGQSVHSERPGGGGQTGL